jgi:hypothetical protein
MENRKMDDSFGTRFSFVMTIAVLFTFLSDNPEISFITKDHFIWGIVSF